MWDIRSQIISQYILTDFFCRSSFGRYSIMKLDQGRPTTTIMDLKPSILTPEQQLQHTQVNNLFIAKCKTKISLHHHYLTLVMQSLNKVTRNEINEETKKSCFTVLWLLFQIDLYVYCHDRPLQNVIFL